MNERRWERLGAEAGIAFVVLAVVATFLPGSMPDQNASGTTLITWIADHRDSLRWGMALFGVASVCGLFFIAALRARLSEADGGHREMATAAVIGGVFAFAANWMGGLMANLAVQREGIGLAPSTVRSYWDAYLQAGTLGNVGLAVMFGAVAAVVLSTGMLPRWVGWLSAAVAVNCVVSLFGFVASDGAFAPGGTYQIVSGLAGLAGLLALSVELLMHAEAPARAGAPAMSASS